MILPEHKAAALRQAAEVQAMPRPTLDDQEIALINAAIMQSKAYRHSAAVTLYTGFEPRIITGIVTRIDRSIFRLDIVDSADGGKDWEWIQFADVLKAELSKEWTEEEMQGHNMTHS